MKKILLLGLFLLIASCGSEVTPKNPQSQNSSATPITKQAPNTSPPTSTPKTNGNIQSAKVTEILDGEQVFIRDRKAAIDDVAKWQEQIRTGESRTELEFSNSAIARLNKNSLLTVGDCGVRLQQGSLLVNGAVPACTSSMVAAVHGTTYILEVDEQGNDQIQVLEGEVAVTRKDEAKSQIQIVRGGEKFRIFPKQKKVELVKISQGEYETLLSSPFVKGHKRDLPSREKINSKFKQLFPRAKPVLVPNTKSALEKKNAAKNDVKNKIERSDRKEQLQEKGKPAPHNRPNKGDDDDKREVKSKTGGDIVRLQPRQSTNKKDSIPTNKLFDPRTSDRFLKSERLSRNSN
jgi:hypothetical protein